MSTKYKNTKKKSASLGIENDNNGDYVYIDPKDTTSQFIPVRNKNKDENK